MAGIKECVNWSEATISQAMGELITLHISDQETAAPQDLATACKREREVAEETPRAKRLCKEGEPVKYLGPMNNRADY